MKVHLEVPARPVALVTGVGRKRGIGAGIGRRLVSLVGTFRLHTGRPMTNACHGDAGGDETGEVVEERRGADLQSGKKTSWSRQGPGLIAPRIG